jgi:hypothetical protein
LISNKKDEEEVRKLFHAPMDRVESSLKPLFSAPNPPISTKPQQNSNIPQNISNKNQNNAMKASEAKVAENVDLEAADSSIDKSSLLTRIIIEALNGKYAWSVTSMMDYLSYSYVSMFVPVADMERAIRQSFAYLIEKKFVALIEEQNTDLVDPEPRYGYLSPHFIISYGFILLIMPYLC